MSQKKQNATLASTQERVNDLGKTAVKTVSKTAQAEANKMVHAAWDQLIGASKKGAESKNKLHNEAEKSRNTDIFDIITFNTRSENTGAEKKTRTEAHMNYTSEIARSSERASRVELSELDQQIRQIKQELSQLVHSSKELKQEFTEFAVETSTPTIGQYHMKFFEWLLIVIRQARQKVESGGAWMGAVQGKNAKRGYWGMAQKGGTSFTLSGERTVATQTG